jgi:hypothetical protein
MKAFHRGNERFRAEVDARHAAGGFFSGDEIRAMPPSHFREVLDSAASIQRGAPERHMLRVQKASGGGVYSHAAEHIGDLPHRIGEGGGTYREEFVKPKVDRMHSLLHSGYGFEREMNENHTSNGADPEEVRSLGEHYALLHSTVPSYNEPMALGTSAAINLGLHKFGRTRQALTSLKTFTDDHDKYPAAISQEASADYVDTHRARQRMDIRRQAMGRI